MRAYSRSLAGRETVIAGRKRAGSSRPVDRAAEEPRQPLNMSAPGSRPGVDGMTIDSRLVPRVRMV